MHNLKAIRRIFVVLCNILLLLLLLTILTLLSGCTTTRTVTEHRTDTLLITRHQRDSIFFHDSIHVREQLRGDTFYVEIDKWHTRYIDRTSHDTTYIATHDTLPDPYFVQLRQQLTPWQQIRLWLGNILLVALLAAAGWASLRILRKFRIP